MKSLRIPLTRPWGITPGVGALLLVLAMSWIWMGCDLEGGSIDNEESSGWQERGRDPGDYVTDRTWDEETAAWTWKYELRYSDVILSPDGNHLLASVPLPGPGLGYDKPGLALKIQALPDGPSRLFPELVDLVRTNFSPDGSMAYFILDEGMTLAIVELSSMRTIGTLALPVPCTVVDPTPDGRTLVLSNLPTTDIEELAQPQCVGGYSATGIEGLNRCQLTFVDLETGDTWSIATPEPIRDIDFPPDSSELLLTSSSWNEENVSIATIDFYDLATRTILKTTRTENCADEVVLDRTRNLALLSPTRCSRDPISVVDYESRETLTRLPGFGPVAVSESLGLAVGFTRKADMETEWNYHDQTMEYGIIFVDLETFDWTVKDYGSHMPLFTMSPDGQFLYVYNASSGHYEEVEGQWVWQEEPSNLSFYDLNTLERHHVATDKPRLDRFVWTRTGDTMFVLSKGHLYKVPAGQTTLSVVALPYTLYPELINIRQQGDLLVLGESDQPLFHLLPLVSEGESVNADPAGLTTLDLSL